VRAPPRLQPHEPNDDCMSSSVAKKLLKCKLAEQRQNLVGMFEQELKSSADCQPTVTEQKSVLLIVVLAEENFLRFEQLLCCLSTDRALFMHGTIEQLNRHEAADFGILFKESRVSDSPS